MYTYIRILFYAKPLGKLMPLYCITALLSIIFSLFNFGLLIPLFDILFDKAQHPVQLIYAQKIPPFSCSIVYIKEIFYYFFTKIILQYGKLGALYSICIFFAIAVFTTNFFRYITAYIMAIIRTRIIYNLRTAMFKKITTLHIGYFTTRKKGDIVSKATNDIHQVEHLVINTFKIIFKDPAQIICFFILLFYISYQLTIFTIILLPISGFFISKIIKIIRKKATLGQSSIGRITSMLEETIFGIRIIKAFSAEKYIINKFRKENKRYAKLNIGITKRAELVPPISEFLGVLVMIIILAYGGKLVIHHRSTLSASEFITYIIIFSQIISPTKAMFQAFSNMQQGLASLERIFQIIDAKPSILNNKGAIVIKEFKYSLTLKNVTFSYDQKSILSNINLTIKKGEVIALVGPSGGGKSTLIDLIPRFYDPTAGAIYIDDVDIKNCTVQSLRNLMGIVTQETILFHDTVEHNIAFGKPNCPKKSIIEAAKIAHAHQFIMQLPQGYQTIIGERGIKLSGGQRQRICIARAILHNPPILMLDEATSSLDTVSEKLVQDALKQLMQHRTSIVVAHRLSTVRKADKIIVINNGKIEEQGQHNLLKQNQGLYSQLIACQTII